MSFDRDMEHQIRELVRVFGPANDHPGEQTGKQLLARMIQARGSRLHREALRRINEATQKMEVIR